MTRKAGGSICVKRIKNIVGTLPLNLNREILYPAKSPRKTDRNEETEATTIVFLIHSIIGLSFIKAIYELIGGLSGKNDGGYEKLLSSDCKDETINQ